MLVFDCTGDKGSMGAAIHLLQHGDTLVFVGLINDTVSLFDPDLHRLEATILTSRNSTPAEAPSCARPHGESADRCGGVADRVRPSGRSGQAVSGVAS